MDGYKILRLSPLAVEHIVVRLRFLFPFHEIFIQSQWRQWKHCLVNNRWLVRGGGPVIQRLMKSHPFPGGILDKSISMTHSGMQHRLDISTFYFYELLLFQIFVPWKFITISKNIFIGFKYYTPHKKINQCLTNINQCLTDISQF